MNGFFHTLSVTGALQRFLVYAVHSSRSMILHGPPLDFQKTLQAAGRLRGFHLLVGAARTQEGVHFSLRQTLIGLVHGLDHGRERRAG